ncbi:MAG TPA: calcium/sodium antiporter [Bacteroidales bacterium]|nr:calcium/sodium antiporter [Bacteroidales bacterium]HPJ54630.1 calcium/sodium antiporter [Bacteroidales bacterium]
MDYLLIIAGFVLLTVGANILINGATGLAAKFNISNLVIGLTVVAFGTSAPELVVNVVAAIEGSNEIALTNVLGSNSINTFVILGLSALFYPLLAQRSTIRVEIPLSLFAAVAVLVLGSGMFLSPVKGLSRLDGVFLLLCFTLFIIYIFYLGRKGKAPVADENYKPMGIAKAVSLVVGGLACLAIGAEMIVRSAVNLAVSWGVSQAVVGVTIVALGTSLPELATSVAAAYKKSSDIAVGNIIGSNIFNVFLVLGVSAVIRPLPMYPNLVADAAVAASGSLLVLFFAVFGKKHTLKRIHGIILLAVYAAYLAWIIGTL